MLYLYDSQRLMAPGSSGMGTWGHLAGPDLLGRFLFFNTIMEKPHCFGPPPMDPSGTGSYWGGLTKHELLVTLGVWKPRSIPRAQWSASIGSPGRQARSGL